MKLLMENWKKYLTEAEMDWDAFGFSDEESDDGDYVTKVDGLTIVMDGHSAQILTGATLDYSSNLMASGFKFINPGAKRTCGCGSSFSN